MFRYLHGKPELTKREKYCNETSQAFRFDDVKLFEGALTQFTSSSPCSARIEGPANNIGQFQAM